MRQEDDNVRAPFTPPPVGRWERARMVLMTVSLVAPLRLLLIALLLLLVFPASLCGTKWYLQLSRPIYRAILFVAGFHFIGYERHRGDEEDAGLYQRGPHKAKRRPPVVVANHVSVFDGLLMQWHSPSSVVAKAEVFGNCFLGRILRASRSIPVDRDTREGRAAAVQAIRDRDEDDPPLLVFPEGTTSRPHYLLPFKRGAFLHKGPVRPYALLLDDDATLGIVHGQFFVLYRTLCRLYSCATVVRLPDMAPRDGESPEVFAERVRGAICKTIPRCELSDATLRGALAASGPL